MNTVDAKRVLETALICSPLPIPLQDMRVLFDDELSSDTIKSLLQNIQLEWEQRGAELVKVATGWRFQSRPELRAYLDRLNPEKPPRYTRAALETLAIIAQDLLSVAITFLVRTFLSTFFFVPKTRKIRTLVRFVGGAVCSPLVIFVIFVLCAL